MNHSGSGAPAFRPLRLDDLSASLRLGLADFRAAWRPGLALASVFVVSGIAMAWVTVATGQTFWLILAVLGFPLVGALSVLGFYDTSRRLDRDEEASLRVALAVIWANRAGQVPWLAAIIVVIFLFWFFLAHMIFALFLGLAPMTNILSGGDVFLTPNGVGMLAFGTVVGAILAFVVFGLSVLGIPMLLDREVDFMTAMVRSLGQVRARPGPFLAWGGLVAAFSLLSMVPMYLGLFVCMPVLGHASWRLYHRLRIDEPK